MLTGLAAGDLDTVIEVQKLTTTNVDGNATQSAETIATVWGKWNPLQGRLLERAKSFGETINQMVLIRYRKDIEANPEQYQLRIKRNGKVLTGLVPINDEGRYIQLSIYCVETK